MMCRWKSLLLHLLLLCPVKIACGTSSINNNNNSCVNKRTPLYLMAMAPFPDPEPGLAPGWEGGPAVIPGTLVAIEHINSRCDILEEYWLELLIEDSGCDVQSKALISSFKALFEPARFYNITSSSVIGIIGPGCSEATIAIGQLLASPEISLLNIAPSATSPQLVNNTLYPNTFRPIASSLGFLQIYRDFLLLKGFTNVAVLFEAERTFHTLAASRFVEQLREISIQAPMFGMFDTLIPLSSIENTYPIIFVFGGGEIARKLMCLAARRKMLYPNYQFIFSERRINHFDKNVSVLDEGMLLECSDETMREAIHGVILNLIQLTRTDHAETLVNQMNYTQFYQAYKDELESFTEAGNYSNIVDTEHESGFYDSTWALALSLNASIPRLRERMNISLSDYKSGCPGCTEIIREELLRVQFEGIRGTVRFSNDTLDGENVTIIEMFFVEPDESGQPTLRQVAHYDPSLPKERRLNIVNETVFIDDIFVRENILPPIFVEIIVFVVLAITTVTTVFFQVLTLKWTGAKSVKATSPTLNHIIFAGCYLYLISVLFLSPQLFPSSQNPVVFGVKCSGFIWCESIALTLIFATICVKTWRVFRIFSHASADVLVHLEDYRLILYVCILLFLDVVFNVAWNVVDPWFPDMVAQEELKVRLICNCRNNVIWISCLLAQKVVLGLILLYLSILTRRIPKQEYKQTKSTNALIYSLLFLYSFTIPVYIILLSSINVGLVTVSYLALCFKNFMCIILCTVLIFLPPVLPILRARSRVLVSRIRLRPLTEESRQFCSASVSKPTSLPSERS